jgi:glycosyltransferase involved in cell wall biosynthesis
VPPRNIEALAVSLRQALALDASERARIGARARAHVAQNFTLARMQEQTLAVYDELLGTDLAERFRSAS